MEDINHRIFERNVAIADMRREIDNYEKARNKIKEWVSMNSGVADIPNNTVIFSSTGEVLKIGENLDNQDLSNICMTSEEMKVILSQKHLLKNAVGI